MRTYTNKPCPHCGNFTNRGISIDAVIIKDRSILLIRRGQDPYKGYWATPGGYVGWDETIDDAVVREVKEETGLNVVKSKIVLVNSNPKRHPKQVINFVYLVNAEGFPKEADDAKEIKWYEVNKLPKKLALDHEENINVALKVYEKNQKMGTY